MTEWKEIKKEAKALLPSIHDDNAYDASLVEALIQAGDQLQAENERLREVLDKAEDILGHGLSNEGLDVFQSMRDAMHIISEALVVAMEE